ncbi:MAG: hypothetical protein HYT80_04845 [Euryarchaeota archaeon]|nr:hypothetical protein [Euryarchaeota archaeon]
MRHVWLALAGLVLLAPSALAQASPPRVDFEGASRETPLRPETEFVEFTLKARVGCTQADYSYQATTVVRFEVVTNASSVVVQPGVEPATRTLTFSPSECTSSPDFVKEATTHFTATLSRDAPAFEVQRVQVLVHVEKPDLPQGRKVYGPYSANVSFFADYIALTSITPATYFQKAGENDKVVFPFDMMNLGNGNSRVRTEVIPLGRNRLDSIIPPAETRLESKAARGTSALFKLTSRIEATTPSAAGTYSFQAKFVTVFEGSSEFETQTDETVVVFVVQVGEGSFREAPAPPMVLALAVLGAMVLWRRRP